MAVSRRLFLTTGAAALFAAVPATGSAETYEPKRGSAERKAILNSIRPRIEAEMRGPVEFLVSSMRVSDGWAFCILEPQRPGGGAIDPAQTAYAGEAAFMDGLTVYALARHAHGRWHLIDSVTGPTDVAFEPWPRFYGAPAAIFGF